MASPETAIVAWWGAIISTIVLIWDIIKWRLTGPKLRLTVTSGMIAINMPEYKGKKMILAEVVNYGNRPTTITNLGLFFFRGWWSRLKRKPDQSFIVATPSRTHPIPYELKQGTTWKGILMQDEDVEKMVREGFLICALYHSHRKRPLRRRIMIREKPKQE